MAVNLYNIKTPGMKVHGLSTAQELLKWKQMYENPFFNKGICINDVYLRTVLSYMPGAKPPKKRPTHQPPATHVYFWTPIPAKIPKPRPPVASTEKPNTADLYSAKPERSPSPPRVMHRLPPSSHPLPRRPRLPTLPNSHPHHVDLDKWKTHSFTTVCVDDPMDPNGYYKKNYPLVMMKVPRREKSPEDPEYTALPQLPASCMNFFDKLPLSKLETPPSSEED